MAFMNKKKPNKVVLWIIIIFISLGLLGTVGGWMFSPGAFSTGDPTTNSTIPADASSEVKGNLYFEQSFDKMRSEDYEGAKKLFQDAISEYEKYMEKDSQNTAVLGNLATSYFYTGMIEEDADKIEKAIELVKKTLEIDPNFTQARFNYAIYLADGQNKYMDAIKELQKIKPEDPRYQDAQQLIEQYFSAVSAKDAVK